jgi:hypothetical protein
VRSACLGAGLATWEGKARKSKDRGVVVVRVMMTHSLPPEMRPLHKVSSVCPVLDTVMSG